MTAPGSHEDFVDASVKEDDRSASTKRAAMTLATCDTDVKRSARRA